MFLSHSIREALRIRLKLDERLNLPPQGRTAGSVHLKEPIHCQNAGGEDEIVPTSDGKPSSGFNAEVSAGVILNTRREATLLTQNLNHD